MEEQDSRIDDELAEPVTPPEQPAVTFQGNSIDLASLGAMVVGLLSLFMCMSCNMGFYCLPVIPVILGLVGLISARQAVDVRRTRLWSWIGIGTGLFFFLLIAVAFLAYITLMIILILSAGEQTYWLSLAMLFGV